MKKILVFTAFLFFCFSSHAADAGGTEGLLQALLKTDKAGGSLLFGDSFIRIMSFIALITIVPACFILMTSFTRIIIVLSFLRQGLGLSGVPSNQLMLGLSVVLSMVAMSPVLQKVYDDAYQPFVGEKIDKEKAVEVAGAHFVSFMKKNTREKDLLLVQELTNNKVENLVTVLPAFAISELKTAFLMGFLIYLPFLLVDLIVTITVMAIGLQSLNPNSLSLPLKVLLFLVIDGWTLLMGSFVKSFHF